MSPDSKHTVNRWVPKFTTTQVVALVIAALAMVATLPGRTHGLGLITEPMLADLHVTHLTYSDINLWATLIGAAFCIPCGWLLDRLGTRLTLVSTCMLLGLVVVGMTTIPTGNVMVLFVFVLLTRGFGQSALSVVSLAIMGKAVGKRSNIGVAVYSVLCTVGFMAAFAGVKVWESSTSASGEVMNPSDHWRTLWMTIGWSVLGFGVLGWVFFPRETDRGKNDPEQESPGADRGFTVWQAVRTPAFWAFALATSFYGMIASGISLFNQSILQERGFDRDLFLTITMIGPFLGLVANLSTGFAATRVALPRLLSLAMLLIAGALLCFPFVQSLWQVYAYAVTLSVGGGMITVLFFAVWSRFYGTAHLGKIQGAAQMLTVFASALGPKLLAQSQATTGSYTLLYQCAGGVSVVLAVWAFFVQAPRVPEHQDDLMEPIDAFQNETGDQPEPVSVVRR